MNFWCSQFKSALYFTRRYEKLILTAIPGRIGEMTKSVCVKRGKEGIMVRPFDVFGQDKYVRVVFFNGADDP